MFAIIAYRWGWTNHWYMVGVEKTEEKAILLAMDESESRGGKYGVTVYDENTNIVGHSPSSYNEEEPYHNARITMFEMIGNKITLEYERGADMPEWIKGVVEKKSLVSGATINKPKDKPNA